MMKSEKQEYLKRPENFALANRLGRLAWVFSSVVLLLVVAMQRIRLDVGFDTSFLPPVHAAINGIAAAVLIVALIAIKRGSVVWHKRAIFIAMVLSVLFLLSYVLYHISNDPTRYGGEGVMKLVYLFLLLSHILSAALSLPFILFAFISGFTNQFARHRRLVRWVFPLWLYVAITGPICYLMLRPYYSL